MTDEDRMILEWCEWWYLPNNDRSSDLPIIDLNFLLDPEGYVLPKLEDWSLLGGTGIKCRAVISADKELLTYYDALDENPTKAFKQALVKLIKGDK